MSEFIGYVCVYSLGVLTIPLFKRRKQIFQLLKRTEEEFEEKPKYYRPKGLKYKKRKKTEEEE